MGDISSLYPQAPAPIAPVQNGFSTMTPTGVVGLVNGINQAKMFQQVYDARQGVADAYRNNVNADGSVNQAGLARDLARSGFEAGEALHQGTINADAQFGLQTKQTQFLRDSIGTLADLPTPTQADLAHWAASTARNVPSLAPASIQRFVDDAPTNPRELKKYLVQQRNLSIGSAGLSQETSGNIDPRTGVAPKVSVGQANYQNVGIDEEPGRAPGRVTALPVGSSSVMEDSAKAYSTALEGAGRYAQRVNPLRQAIPILEHMKETEIGPLSERWNDLKSAAVNLGAGPLLGIDPKNIQDANELRKYFKQYAGQAGAILGPKTNDGLAAAVTSNPNMKMDKLSATELSKVALGIERMQQAGVLEFNNLVSLGLKQPSDFSRYLTEWATKQDPRAFVYDLMSKDQQDKLRRSLPKAELDKIRNGMNIADRHGLLGDVHLER